MLRPILTATALVVLPASAAMATPDAPVEAAAQTIGPQVGETAPAFTATTRNGDTIDLAAISGEHGAVIVFSRSLDWCPYCKKQALELQAIAAPLAEAGWPLALITYDPPETLTRFAEANDLTYTLLSDDGSAMIDAFGLRNQDVPAGSRFDGIPHPAIVFIDTDGMVRAVQREEGYKVRPSPDGVVAEARALNAAAAAD